MLNRSVPSPWDGRCVDCGAPLPNPFDPDHSGQCDECKLFDRMQQTFAAMRAYANKQQQRLIDAQASYARMHQDNS